jgi:hypothetical protein
MDRTRVLSPIHLRLASVRARNGLKSMPSIQRHQNGTRTLAVIHPLGVRDTCRKQRPGPPGHGLMRPRGGRLTPVKAKCLLRKKPVAAPVVRNMIDVTMQTMGCDQPRQPAHKVQSPYNMQARKRCQKRTATSKSLDKAMGTRSVPSQIPDNNGTLPADYRVGPRPRFRQTPGAFRGRQIC